MNKSLALKLRLAATFLIAALIGTGCATSSTTSATPTKTSGATKSSSIPAHPEDIPVKEIVFKPRNPEIRKLSNGITVYMLEDHELPLISSTVMFPNGSLSVPRELTGMDNLLSSAWSNGGTESMPGELFEEAQEEIAASIGANVGNETSSIFASGLSQDRKRILEMAAELALKPALLEEKIELSRLSQLERIRRQNDNPNAVTRRTYRKLFYGADHPLAWEPTVESVSKPTRDDIVSFYKTIIGAKETRISITGDFKSDEAFAELEKLYGSIDNPNQVVAEFAPTPAPPQPGLYVASRAGSQTIVRMGHLGLPRHHPDYFAIQVYNEIFGTGGFNSRLTSDIRSTRGLTYGVFGMMTLDGSGGEFMISSSTRNNAARELTDAALFQVERMRSEPVTAKELALAKNAIINSYVFRFDNTAGIVRTRMEQDRLGYPEDWIDRYVPGISAVTIEDVQRVAKEHTDSTKLAILLVGPEAELVGQFEDSMRKPKVIPAE